MTTATIEKQAVKVGDIFYTSWGYDQTNVEFFKVVRCTEKTVWVQETGQVREYSDWGNGDYWKTSSNGEILVRQLRDWNSEELVDEIAPITQHKIQNSGRDGEAFIKIDSVAYGWFWDGKPVNASTGH